MPTPARLALRTVVLVLAVRSAAAAQDPDGFGDPPPPATPSAPVRPADPARLKATLAKRLAELRDPKLDRARREEAVREIMSLGADAARQLAPELAKDFAARRKAYPARFEKAAAGVIEPRLKQPAARKEIEGLRQKVLGVSRDRNLTLERIKDFADPARKQLEARLSLSREDVLKADAALAAERETLLATLGWWRAAIEQLPPNPKATAAAKAGGGANAGAAAAAPPDPAAFAAELAAAEELAATLAALPDRKDRSIIQANVEAAKKIDAAEARGAFVLNVLRARLGIGALALDVKLCEASRDHSKDMAELKFFDHISPVPGKEEPWDRARAAGTTATGENIYQGGERGEDAIEGWWHSPGHHANMMADGHKRVGMGRHEGHWTQMFGG